MNKTFWQVDTSSAKFETDDLAALVSLADPKLGMTALRVGGAPVEHLSLFQVTNIESQQPTECVPRGNDLIVSYPPTNDWPVTTEVYWRVATRRPAPSIDFIISVETEQLDTAPEIFLQNHLGGHADAQQLADGLTLVSLLNAPTDLAMMTLPAEYLHQTEINASAVDGPITVESRLQFGPLEKGVIRRARMRAAFLPSEDAKTAAAECFAEFAASALPLTV